MVLTRTPSDFLNALSQATPEKSPESYAIGVSNSIGDIINGLIGRLQKVHRTLHP